MKKRIKVLIEKYKEKKCTKCKKLMPIVDFHTTLSNKNGLASHCKYCYNAHKRAKYLENPEFEKAKKEKFYKNNPDYIKNYNKINWKYIQAMNKIYREVNADSIRIQKKLTYDKNRKSIIEKVILYEKNRIKIDQLYKLKKTIRKSITGSFKKQGFKKNTRTQVILGCSFDEFKLYIESKFELWMNWDNYGKCNGELNFGWDLDHIIPVASAKTKEEIFKLNHYTNFQPLCSYINRNIKRDNTDFVL